VLHGAGGRGRADAVELGDLARGGGPALHELDQDRELHVREVRGAALVADAAPGAGQGDAEVRGEGGRLAVRGADGRRRGGGRDGAEGVEVEHLLSLTHYFG